MKKDNDKSYDIAIIGFACRFPGAFDSNQFWDNIKNGVDSISILSSERWNADKYLKDRGIPAYSGFIDDVDLFDAKFFRMQDERAERLDPQTRLLMEIVADTINHAGYDQRELYGSSTGVFIGAGSSHYGSSSEFLTEDKKKISYNSELINHRNAFIGNMPNMISSIVSNHFNFTGSSIVLTTACSSSLVAVHYACQSILCNDCDTVIAGGVQLYLSPYAFLGAATTNVLSLNGKCKTFSKYADGYVLAEGVATVLLKSLDKAIEEKDTVYSIIKSSAINNDGKTMSMVMPNMHAQKNVISMAIKKADIDASAISYIEANGTALQVGDPIEVEALTLAFRDYTDKSQFCAIGSVETNIGHATHAAGMAGLLKVVMSLYKKKIPPTLHCAEINPKIDFSTTPFFPNTELVDWDTILNRRYAGINCFGFGGTNCHILLEDFNIAKYNNYEPIRVPMPPLEYNKKRYWLNES